MAFPLLGTFLASAVGPLAKKVLVALGLGTVTYTGLSAAFFAASAQITASYGAISGGALALIDMSGAGTAIGIILAAISARIGMIALSKIGMVL